MHNNTIFYVSLLDQYAAPVVSQSPSDSKLTIVDDAGDQDQGVKLILDTKAR